MRFHLVDRVDAHEPARSVRARKLTSASESYWRDQGGESIMPPPLILEALCQAGTWLIMLSTERRLRAALLQVERVTFTGSVRPGDVLGIEGNVESMNDEMAVLSGSVTVGEDVIMTATGVMCALLPAGRLAGDEEGERMLTLLTRS